jgi:hypothetical protein
LKYKLKTCFKKNIKILFFKKNQKLEEKKKKKERRERSGSTSPAKLGPFRMGPRAIP